MTKPTLLSGIRGAIFDVDDTLLDNQATGTSLFALSRIAALDKVADKYGLDRLRGITPAFDVAAFKAARHHSFEGGTWEILYQKGVVGVPEIDLGHPLLCEIVALADEGHATILRCHGAPVAGAERLVEAVASVVGGRVAIASTAKREHIDIFLDEITLLRQYFPSSCIVAKEDIPHDRLKPNPEAFHRAYAALGLPDSVRGSVVVFEDDPRGVQAAKAAGLYVVAITTRYPADSEKLLAAQPDIIIDSYDQLFAAL